MTTLAPARPFTLDDVLDFLNELDTEPQVPCDWGCKAPATWQVKYEPCGHWHNICGRCRLRVVQQQQVADEATPPRPYASYHKCCGKTIWRAHLRTL